MQRERSQDAPLRPRPAASRRRDKPQLSCNLCRRRKQPCSMCLARRAECTYVDNHAAASPSTQPPTADSSVQDRIVHLERLVMSMMQNSNHDSRPNDQSQSTTPQARASEDVPPESGDLRMNASEHQYVGSDHWTAIMTSFASLKEHLGLCDRFEPSITHQGQDIGEEQPGDSTLESHALLLFGHHRRASKAEIMSSLPPKNVVDRYIARYFNHQELVSCTIHGPTFLKEYEAFWTDSSNAPLMWIGLLFGMICLAVLVTDEQISEAEKQWCQVDVYRARIVDCLIVGEYTKSGPFVLETVIHYVYIEFGIRVDADKDVWFLLALMVNLAKRMGYHRDPRHFPSMSPLQGEMRRRVWATIWISDILVSNQMGMPRMISDRQCDTAELRNINDDDMDEHTTELPVSRPETEYTSSLAIIARTRILTALGAVSDLLASLTPYSYDEVMRVDRVLDVAAERLPPPLKKKPMAVSITESSQLIMSRLFVNHLLHKGKIMLHQRYHCATSSPHDRGAFEYSRTACLDACIEMLRFQQILDEETRPGGRLSAMRWRISSLVKHQFLTASMVLCALLHSGGERLQRREEVIAMLRNAQAIWARSSPASKEAHRAAEAVKVVLTKAEATITQTEYSSANHATEPVVQQATSAEHPSAVYNISAADEQSIRGQSHLPCSWSAIVDNLPVAEPQLQGFYGDFALSQPRNLNYVFNPSISQDDRMLDEWITSTLGPGWP